MSWPFNLETTFNLRPRPPQSQPSLQNLSYGLHDRSPRNLYMIGNVSLRPKDGELPAELNEQVIKFQGGDWDVVDVEACAVFEYVLLLAGTCQAAVVQEPWY